MQASLGTHVPRMPTEAASGLRPPLPTGLMTTLRGSRPAPPTESRPPRREFVRRLGWSRWREEALSRAYFSRRLVEEVQGGGRRDQAGRGDLPGQPLPQGSEENTAGLRVSAAALRLVFCWLIFSKSFSCFPCSRAPFTLERVTAASIMGSAETSTTTRRIDPFADLREATEQNAQ